MSKLVDRALVVATSAVTYIAAAAAGLTLAAAEIAAAAPPGYETATAWALRAAAWLGATVTVIRRVAPAPPGLRGLLPPPAALTTSWLHVASGLFFRRVDDGAVQIGQGTNFDDVAVIQTIDPSSWATVTAAVSARGADHTTHIEALDFHQHSDPH